MSLDDQNLLKLVAAFTAEDGPQCARITDGMTVSEISKVLVAFQAMTTALHLVLSRRGYEFRSDLAQATIDEYVNEKLGGH